MAITISTKPDPSTYTTLFVGQRLLLTVIATADSGSTISDTATAQLQNLGTGFKFDTANPNIDYSAAQPLKLNSAKTEGRAIFILDVQPGAFVATDLNFSVSVTGATPKDVKWTSRSGRQTPPIVLGPSNAWLPVPPSSLSNPLLPTAANEQYTAAYTVTFKDNNNKPDPYNVVDWHELAEGGQYSGIFLSQMYTYLSRTATTPLTTADEENVILGADNIYFIRSYTSDTGIAYLYLVADNQNVATGPTAGNLNVWPGWMEASPTPGYVVSNLSPPSGDASMLVPTPGSIDQDTGRVDYTLDKTTSIPVSIVIPTATTGDPIYTFINGKLGDAFLYNSDTADTGYNSKFPKIYGHSDYGTDANLPNDLIFVWVNRSNQTINVSADQVFLGEHDKGDNVPIGGIFQPASLTQGGNVINRYFVQDDSPDVGVKISLEQRIYNYFGKLGDIIQVTGYFTGYNGQGVPKDYDFVTSAPITVGSTDINHRYVIATLNKQKFKDWGPEAGTGNKSYCHIVYTVTRAGAANPSLDFPVSVDTTH